MNATMTAEHLTVVGHRMSEAEYDAERAKLAPDKAAAAVRWEQALAVLFARSNWTQEQLAKKEGKNQSWVARQLLFGRFLSFMPMGINPENTPNNPPWPLNRRRWGSPRQR